TIIEQFGRVHEIVREMEPDGVHEAVKIKIHQVPEMLPVIIGEVVFHLRSALDHVAGSLAVLNGKTTNGVYFPFAGSPTEFRLPVTQRKIEKLSPAAQKLIRRFKAYKGGNNCLWAMNK